MPFFYVYLLESHSIPTRHYVGFTTDLSRRLHEHNSDKQASTAKHGPWHIRSAHAFPNKAKALSFERYLKSGSGRSFVLRHL